MSTVQTTNLQHPSSPDVNIVLNADGTVTFAGDPDLTGSVIGLILALGG